MPSSPDRSRAATIRRRWAKRSGPSSGSREQLARYVCHTHFDPKIVTAVEQATAQLGYSHRHIVSGAGHDACNLNGVMPTAMIFVPCKDGVSHNELEDATQYDCAAGANVLLHTTLALTGVAAD